MRSHADAVARLTGKAPKPRRSKPPPLSLRISEPLRILPDGTQIITLPIRTVSLNATVREHWMATRRRSKSHHAIVETCMLANPKPTAFPVEVKLTRIAPRAIDSHDNLRAGLKATVDAIAKWLGIDDRDPAVAWSYAQERGEPKTYGVRVEIRRLP